MKKPELLVLVAIFEFLTAIIALICISAITVFAFPWPPWMGGYFTIAPYFGLSIAILMLTVYLGVAIAGGIGLLQGKEWGRALSITHAAVSLLAFPFGTVIGILALVYLFHPEVTDYFKGGGTE